MLTPRKNPGAAATAHGANQNLHGCHDTQSLHEQQARGALYGRHVLVTPVEIVAIEGEERRAA